MEVVKVDLIDSIPEAEQNVSFSQNSSNGNLAAELQVGNITLRLFNGADEHLITTNVFIVTGSEATGNESV